MLKRALPTPKREVPKKLYDNVLSLLRRFDILNLVYPMKNRDEHIYRVEPIIKAKLSAELIAEIRMRLNGESQTESEATDDAS